MKKITILLILAFPLFTFSQIDPGPGENPTVQQGNDTAKIRYQPKTYVTRISLVDIRKPVKGCLYQLKDSSIALVPNALIKQDFTGEREPVDLKIDQVKMIKVRRKGSVLKGTLLGALSGLVIGVIWGIAEGDDKPTSGSWLHGTGGSLDLFQTTAGEKAALYGASCMIPAAAIGAIIGSISVKIPINGNQGTYDQNRKKLRKFSVH